MIKALGSGFAIVAVVAGLVTLFSAAYRVNETEQVIITQFGKPIGEPVMESGLHFKVPFVQEVNRFPKLALEWDGAPNEIPTMDKTYISVDNFARWRIKDPLQYFLRLRDERSAQSRLDDILGSETRNSVAKHALIEVIRTTKEREGQTDSKLLPITKGRGVIEKEIFDRAAVSLEVFGIELLDVRFKRINYHPEVRQQIYERMISERAQIAERFRSEGSGEAARILGEKEKDLKTIESVAYKQVQTIRGEADGKAVQIYADAYNQSPEAISFYAFMKTLESYEDAMSSGTTLVLSTKSEMFKFLKDIEDESGSGFSTPARSFAPAE